MILLFFQLHMYFHSNYWFFLSHLFFFFLYIFTLLPISKRGYFLVCFLCNVKFNRPADKRRHEKTQKHIKNLHISINGDNNNTHVGDNIYK
jgi:hypothetical protein